MKHKSEIDDADLSKGSVLGGLARQRERKLTGGSNVQILLPADADRWFGSGQRD